MNYNNHHFKKLLSVPVQKLINGVQYCVEKLSPIKNNFYKNNQKYTIRDYIIGIIDVVQNSYSWNSYNGMMNGNTLRKKHHEWCLLGVYEDLHKNSFQRFLKTKSATCELKYQSIDSTFIQDINGCKKSSYNKLYRCKKNSVPKGIKITSIVTTSGIPISINIDTAKKYDSTLLPKAIENIIINCNTKKYQNNNRYKQYLLADAGYDSKNNNKLLFDHGYEPIICPNNRNTKSRSLIRKLNKTQKKIYKKRIIVENYHSWIKKFPKIKSLHERNIENYKGLLFLAISLIIKRRIVKNEL